MLRLGQLRLCGPELFAQDDQEGRVLLKVACGEADLAEQAADECPVAVIEVG